MGHSTNAMLMFLINPSHAHELVALHILSLYHDLSIRRNRLFWVHLRTAKKKKKKRIA